MDTTNSWLSDAELGITHDPDDILLQDDTEYLGMPDSRNQFSHAGVDENTDCATFMEMNGRNVFVTDV